jgi:DNA/RNA endonuclease G (NUC1)
VIVPNDTNPGQEWDRYRVPVSEVEQKTGLKFFSNITNPDFLALKDDVDEVPVGPPVPVPHP